MKKILVGNLLVLILSIAIGVSVTGCCGNSSSTSIESPSYKYTVVVTRGIPMNGIRSDPYQTDIFTLTNSGVQFKTTEGKLIYASNYVVYEN